MDWILLSLIAAVLLGIYDLCKKHAVGGNAVLPVLFISNLASATVWLVLMAMERQLPEILHLQPLDLRGHLFLAGKSFLVGTCWIFAYFALKHLPVSIAGPVRSTSPLFTLLGAVLIFHESPTPQQWLGILITLGGFILLSTAGKKEGIVFHKDRWIAFLIVATLLGAGSALYDRFLLGRAGYTPATVQAWFSIYLVVFFAPFALGWRLNWWPRGVFHWRWSIPAIGLMLLLTDFVYFMALADPDAMVSIVTSLRRGSVLVVFAGGILLFKERNIRAKLAPTLLILAGIITLVTG